MLLISKHVQLHKLSKYHKKMIHCMYVHYCQKSMDSIARNIREPFESDTDIIVSVANEIISCLLCFVAF